MALATASLAGKLATPQAVTESVNRDYFQQRLLSQLEASGLQLTGRRLLTSGNALEILALTGAGCDGVLFLLPLYFNGEAHALLSNRLPRQPQDQGYLFQGRRSANFPEFSYWFSRQKLRLSGAEQTVAPVLHYQVYGNCRLDRHLAGLTL